MNVSKTFFQATSLFIIIGAIIAIIGHILKPALPETMSQVDQYHSQLLISEALLILGVPLVIIGLLSLFLYHHGHIKWWGWIGYPLMGLGIIYMDAIQPAITLSLLPLAVEASSTLEELDTILTGAFNTFPFNLMGLFFLTAIIGPILTGISFWRAKVLPSWLAIIMVLFLPAGIILPMFGLHQFPAYLYFSLALYAVYILRNSKIKSQ